MSLLPEKELQNLEEWYRDLQAALGFTANTDRGRVLAGVRKLKDEAKNYAEERRIITKALGYKRWGDLVSNCSSQVGAAPVVTLPQTFAKVPNGWVLGDRKPTYPQMKKRLSCTRELVQKVWAAIDEKQAEQGEDWVAEQRRILEEEFVNSDSPGHFEQECLRFLNGEEETDPKETWVEVAGIAASALEKSTELPLAAVDELLDYADAANVEATQYDVDYQNQSAYKARLWFEYLFTAYRQKSSRPKREEVEATKQLMNQAFELWKCYEIVSANDPLRPSMTMRIYADSITLVMIDEACKTIERLDQEAQGLTTNEWMDAVVAAVAAVNNGHSLVTIKR